MDLPVLVIKYGGSVLNNKNLRNKFFYDVRKLYKRYKIIIVHGGGKEITFFAERLGIKSRFVNGLRYTNKEILEIVLMVLAGKVNKFIVSQLTYLGMKVIGISGLDGESITGVRDISLGYVGKDCICNSTIIKKLLMSGYIVVISSLGYGENKEVLNYNADDVTFAVAKSISADNVVFITDVPGVIVTYGDKKVVLKTLDVNKIDTLITSGMITGGMIPKVLSVKNFIISSSPSLRKKRNVYITNYEHGLFCGTRII